MRLHLGVNDVPYAHLPPALTKRGTRRKKQPGVVTTTGDVAGWLEGNYHVMEVFWNLHAQEAADDIAASLRDALEAAMEGAPVINVNPLAAAESAIEDRFQKFIDNREMESLGIPGVPTQAAKDGVDHRFKAKHRKDGVSRPSFRDTGLYETNFRCWAD